MPEAAAFQPSLIDPITRVSIDLSSDSEVRSAAEHFCDELPYRRHPYAQRNWGGIVHSLCSYQGKLKPAIAHFLVDRFTRPDDVVLDPMAGIGTIPLEARIQGRKAVAGDLSELAAVVSRAKLQPFDEGEVASLIAELDELFAASRREPIDALIQEERADFGMNGPITEYFEPETLREVLLARRFFRARAAKATPSEAVVMTGLLHILHGNRPYALSRRSHPITPFKPTGLFERRPVIERLRRRLDRVKAPLHALNGDGEAYLSDFRSLPLPDQSVDVVITSPPFAQSLKFHASNWMRLWFCGWTPEDFATRPSEFLDKQQKVAFDQAYAELLTAMGELVRPGGLLIMHLGATRQVDMGKQLLSVMARGAFAPIYLGRECVRDTESHGLSDKGATLAHTFLFARRAS